MRFVFLVLLTAAALPLAPVAAQDDRWQVTLPGDEYVWDVRLLRLDGDTLVVRQADTLRALPVAEISEIRRIRKSEMTLGDAARGGPVGAMLGTDDEVYDLSPLDFGDRLRAVQKILLYRSEADEPT